MKKHESNIDVTKVAVAVMKTKQNEIGRVLF